MNDAIDVIVTEDEAGERIDRFIAQVCDVSRSIAQLMLEDGSVVLAGVVPAKSYRVQVGDRISVTVTSPKTVDIVPQDIPLEVVYEDAFLLVLNKGKGMVVHPAPGNPDGTLVNALLAHCGSSLSGIGGVIRPGIVHRIDKDTSGLLVVAKDDRTHNGLAEQFAAHSIDREYQAVVYGHMPNTEGTVDLPIGRSRTDRKKMAVDTVHGKQAVTGYTVLGTYPQFSHLALRLQTGRTHQIRVHMAALGHPVAGDPVYGPKKVIARLRGQCLHAGVLGFAHPITGERMLFEQPLPPYFVAFLKYIGADVPEPEEVRECSSL